MHAGEKTAFSMFCFINCILDRRRYPREVFRSPSASLFQVRSVASGTRAPFIRQPITPCIRVRPLHHEVFPCPIPGVGSSAFVCPACLMRQHSVRLGCMEMRGSISAPSCSECLECALRLPFGFLALGKLVICRSHGGRRRLFHLVGKLYETLRAHFGRRCNESWRFKN